MRYILPLHLIFLLVFSFSTTLPAFSQTKPAPSSPLSEAEKKALVGRELIFHRKYDEGLAYFKKLAAEDPNSLIGSFGQMAIWQARMFENYDYRFDKEFWEAGSENKKLTEKILDDANANVWELFLAGAGSGIRSFYLMRKGSSLKSLGEADTAQKALNKALEKDPTFADTSLGLGMYNYWRSVFTNQLKFFPFFSDRRAEGLSQIEKAKKEGRVVGSLADVSLAFCYFKDRNYSRAIPLLEGTLQKYPENVIAKNLLAESYILTRKYREADRILEGLLKNHPEISVAKIQKGWLYFTQNNLSEARKWYNDFLAGNPHHPWATYALTDLGRIDMREGKEAEAYEHFKQAYRADSGNKTPLRELQKIRRKEGRFGK